MKKVTDQFSHVLIAAIAAMPPTIASIGALVLTLRNSTKVDAVAVKVEEVHHATNSMKDALVAGALREGHTAGVKDEKARARGAN